jgi:hypothetical protein
MNHLVNLLICVLVIYFIVEYIIFNEIFTIVGFKENDYLEVCMSNIPDKCKKILICIGIILLCLIVYFYGWNIISNRKNDSVIQSGNRKKDSVIQSINGELVEIQDNWIYYLNKDELYKIKTDGSCKTKLINISGTVYSEIDGKCMLRGTGVDYDSNSDFIQIAGNWIYYLSYREDKLYKIKTDGSTIASLDSFSNSSGTVNIEDGWIYYYLKDDTCLYKMKTDGSCKTKLCDHVWDWDMIVKGDWIYYTDNVTLKATGNRIIHQSYLYKIKTDESQKIRLTQCNDVIIIREVVGDWIYYLKDDNCLYKMKTDGSCITKLSIRDDGYIDIEDGWIYYYLKVEDDTCLYKMKTDGSCKTKLCDHVRDMIIKGDWIYYGNILGLYKIKTDGTHKTRLDDGNDRYDDIHIVNDWIYYSGHIHMNRDETVNDTRYRIKTDGTFKKKIYSTTHDLDF